MSGVLGQPVGPGAYPVEEMRIFDAIGRLMIHKPSNVVLYQVTVPGGLRRSNAGIFMGNMRLVERALFAKLHNEGSVAVHAQWNLDDGYRAATFTVVYWKRLDTVERG